MADDSTTGSNTSSVTTQFVNFVLLLLNRLCYIIMCYIILIVKV